MVYIKSSSACEYFDYDNDKEKGSEKHYFIYENGKIWSEVVTSGSTKNTYYHHTDHLGTTICISDSTGKLIWECEKDAFGNILSKTNSNFVPNFTGKLLDEITNLYYFNARWYDSDMGRFITEDPVRDGMNWYVYCGNNPVRYVDPSGLSTCVDEKTGIILSATNDNDCGVYAYPTVDGQRVEGPGLLIGFTGNSGYFVSENLNPGNIQIAGQEKNYIGKNISNYGSSFAYGDFNYYNDIDLTKQNSTSTNAKIQPYQGNAPLDSVQQSNKIYQIGIGLGVFLIGAVSFEIGVCYSEKDGFDIYRTIGGGCGVGITGDITFTTNYSDLGSKSLHRSISSTTQIGVVSLLNFDMSIGKFSGFGGIGVGGGTLWTYTRTVKGDIKDFIGIFRR